MATQPHPDLKESKDSDNYIDFTSPVTKGAVVATNNDAAWQDAGFSSSDQQKERPSSFYQADDEATDQVTEEHWNAKWPNAEWPDEDFQMTERASAQNSTQLTVAMESESSAEFSLARNSVSSVDDTVDDTEMSVGLAKDCRMITGKHISIVSNRLDKKEGRALGKLTGVPEIYINDYLKKSRYDREFVQKILQHWLEKEKETATVFQLKLYLADPDVGRDYISSSLDINDAFDITNEEVIEIIKNNQLYVCNCVKMVAEQMALPDLFVYLVLLLTTTGSGSKVKIATLIRIGSYAKADIDSGFMKHVHGKVDGYEVLLVLHLLPVDKEETKKHYVCVAYWVRENQCSVFDSCPLKNKEMQEHRIQECIQELEKLLGSKRKMLRKDIETQLQESENNCSGWCWAWTTCITQGCCDYIGSIKEEKVRQVQMKACKQIVEFLDEPLRSNVRNRLIQPVADAWIDF